MGVYEIEMDYLIFNQHNGRLESVMQTWRAETGTSDGDYDDELHKKIIGFLWQTNVSRNKRTLENIKDIGQQNPGIVTLDGVIIDGNRRAMLLQRLEKKYFEAVILPDKYNENEKDIVRLETQYQLGQDPTLDYGPLEKYLHAKRLTSLGIDEQEARKMMNLSNVNDFKELLAIMGLMDDYLEHIQCGGLYTLLRDDDGTKEGMFVDLYSDLKRLRGDTQVNWGYDKDVDLMDLQAIHFDYIRYGDDFIGTEKRYRRISHDGAGKKSIFANVELWKEFRDRHRKKVNPVLNEVGTFDEFFEKKKDDFRTRTDAAKHWIDEWKTKAAPALKENFGILEDSIKTIVDEEIEPNRLLLRAINALKGIDIDKQDLTANPENRELVSEINRLSWEMKKKFEKAGKHN